MGARAGRGAAGQAAGGDEAPEVRAVRAALEAVAEPARAAKEKAYLKSELEHLGASVPAIRRVALAVWKERARWSRGELLALVEGLWSSGVHELRMAAVELLDLGSELLEPRDLDLLERLVRESRTWALVDGLAASVAGALLERHPQLGDSLDRWAGDPDFWVRRAALLAFLLPLRAGRGDFARFARYADAMLEEPEFFVRKAIGWVLRETAKKRPELVEAWLLPRARRAAGLTVREALKPLPPEAQARILSARRELGGGPSGE